ncbi:MAG TPA: parallel beta-helix domain-containing protein [Candidatus Sulfomarinibacteraceae bacterium]|nr:parallel beta-helix domain-containing protein [Candidatus Sulfomarinibacteraceae bacterium]
MSTLRKWLPRLLVVLLLVPVLLFLVAGASAVPADPQLPPEEWGAGASSVEPSYSGLQREFPPTNEPADNPTTPEKVALGRLLFFDPVLSADDDMACATCHHPDYGFSDGLPSAVGRGGEGAGPRRDGGALLDRNTPGLWNVAYEQALFWDGRVDSLEEQALTPLTHDDEMAAADEDALLAELSAIPQYAEMFEAAFDDGLTMLNLQRALAAFQRTLISDDSPFDRYAAGNVNALTPQQRRGLTLFRSGATRCFECHAAPTFNTKTFRVIGVPGDDEGRGAFGDHPSGACKVPSLRNVALTAPYMHNGSLETLEEVIDFYAAGGGRAHGMENVDPFVSGFELTEQERADLVAFLYALTDESTMPEVPDSVPSGLPVIPRLENPAREVVAEHTSPLLDETATQREPRTIRVQPGETIQAAADRARPGDTIEVPYGVYHETVAIDTNEITLLGLPDDEGLWPVLDGQGQRADGVIASGNQFEMGFFEVRNYTDNGVLVEGVTGVHLHDLLTVDTGTYGVYPVQSSDVLLERIEVTGVDDAGIYAGQCEDVIVRDSVAYGNVLGIEIENTVRAEVYDNHTYDNSVGIFVVLLPNLTSKVSVQTLVYDNVAENNNHENFAPEEAIASLMPPGIGILLLGSDDNEVYNNVIRDNKSSGMAVFSLTSTGAFEQLDVGPLPERNHIYNNEYENNGYDPDPFVASLGIPTGDILWDGSGGGNVFDEPEAQGGFPPLLPRSSWPAFVQRAYWHALDAVIRVAG